MAKMANVPLLVSIGCIAVATVGTAFSATLLRSFSNAAGFEGHMIAHRPIGPLSADGGASIAVRLDTNVMPGLPWHFVADRTVFDARIGVPTIAFLEVENRGDAPMTGRAILSITPDPASYHFMKADSFANQDVTLAPGETVRVPIAFYFDGSTSTDPEMAGIRSATVSYTFFSQARAAGSAVPLRVAVASTMKDIAINAVVTYSADPKK